MRFQKCHGERGGAQNLCLPWTSISHDALLIEHKINHGEAGTERGSARSVCLGRRDEQNRLRWGGGGGGGVGGRAPESAPGGVFFFFVF